MADTVALRYCGGCNPRYDRGGLVRQLTKRFSNLQFVPFSDSEQRLLAVLVICGCTAACAGQRDLPGSVPRLVITSAEGLDKASAFLFELSKEN